MGTLLSHRQEDVGQCSSSGRFVQSVNIPVSVSVILCQCIAIGVGKLLSVGICQCFAVYFAQCFGIKHTIGVGKRQSQFVTIVVAFAFVVRFSKPVNVAFGFAQCESQCIGFGIAIGFRQCQSECIGFGVTISIAEYQPQQFTVVVPIVVSVSVVESFSLAQYQPQRCCGRNHHRGKRVHSAGSRR